VIGLSMIKSGEHIGPYHIKGTLGSGGMAIVYRAKDTVNGRDVALKCIQNKIYTEDKEKELEGFARFKREAKILAKLKHPNIVEVYDYLELPAVTCFAMEAVEGETLQSHFYRNRTPENEFAYLDEKKYLPILTDVVRAFAAAHKRQIFHRDIKPSNIIIEEKTNRAVLLDFGLARGGGQETLTKTGSVLGTLFYLAPEQIKAQKIGGYTDVYGWGLVAHHLLSGHLPFEENDDVTMAVKRTANDIPPISEVAPHLSDNICEVIDRCLERNPLDRFHDGNELLKALAATCDYSKGVNTHVEVSENRQKYGRDRKVSTKNKKREREQRKQNSQEKNRTNDSSRRIKRNSTIRALWFLLFFGIISGGFFFYSASKDKSSGYKENVNKSEKISLSRLQPPLNKIVVSSIDNDRISFSFSTVNSTIVELYSIDKEKESVLSPQNSNINLQTKTGVMIAKSKHTGCHHKLEFTSSSLKGTLYFKFLMHDQPKVTGLPIDINQLLKLAVMPFSQLIKTSHGDPERCLAELVLLASKATKEEKNNYHKEELNKLYTSLLKEFSRIKAVLPWFLMRCKSPELCQKAAMAYCLLQYIPHYAKNENITLMPNLNTLNLPDSKIQTYHLTGCTQFSSHQENSINKNFSPIANCTFPQELKIYNRKKIISYAFTSPNNFASNKKPDPLIASIALELNDKINNPEEINVTFLNKKDNIKVIKLIIGDILRDQLLDYDFIVIEMNINSQTPTFSPLVSINNIPLFLNIYNKVETIEKNIKIGHTFPSSFLKNSNEINVRLFPDPQLVKSQRMILKSISFSKVIQ